MNLSTNQMMLRVNFIIAIYLDILINLTKLLHSTLLFSIAFLKSIISFN